MLSGIGDQKEVAKHGIQLVKHLPGVGKNLQTHMLVPVLTNNKSGKSYYEGMGERGGNVAQTAQRDWLIRREGPLKTFGVRAVANLRTSQQVSCRFERVGMPQSTKILKLSKDFWKSY